MTRARAAAWALLWLSVAATFAAPPGEAQATAPADPGVWHEARAGEALRSYRVTLEVPVPPGMEGVRNLPVQRTLDLAEILAKLAGHPSRTLASGATTLQGFELDPSSFTLWESGPQGARRLPVLVNPAGADFDPAVRPVVLARWVMDGETNAKRTFHLYFDDMHDRGAASAGTVDPALQSVLASSIGPGRGNRLFVPLHDLPGAQGSTSERRKVWITNLFPGENEVKVYEYRFGMPDLREPAATAMLEGSGDVYAYTLGKSGLRSSEGGLFIRAERPVVAEARSATDDFKGNQFLPSVDGGYVGHSFWSANPGPVESWAVHCPAAGAVALPSGAKGCQVALNKGAAQVVLAGRTLRLSVSGNPVAGSLLEAAFGQVAVQRLGKGLAAWPALDGPDRGAAFMGWAGPQDALLASSAGDACVLVQSLAGAGSFLTDRKSDRLCLEGGTLADSQFSWGSGWGRAWETGAAHADGPAAVQGYVLQDGVPQARPLAVVSGALDDPLTFSSLVVPQSTDGGFDHLVHVPSPRSDSGLVLGKIVVHALFGGTTGEAVRIETGDRVPIGPLRALQRLELGAQDLGGAGTWRISTDQPVVVAWLKRGDGDFTGPVPAFTEGGQVDLAGAAYVGPALGLVTDDPIVQRQPGGEVAFRAHVENRGRTLAGQALRDRVTLDVTGEPSDWPQASVVPGTLELSGTEGPVDVTVFVDIPADADASTGGVSLALTARSGNDPDLAVDESLRINFIVRRGVDVKVGGSDVEARRELDLGATARHLITVRNTGGVADSYRMALSPPSSAWGYTLPPGLDTTWSTGPLAAGQSATVELEVWPRSLGAAPAQITNVRAISESDRSVFDTVRIVTVVGVERTFRAEAEEPNQSAEPGGTARFLVRIHNDADVNEELHVETLHDLPDGPWPAAQITWLREGGKEVPLAAVNHVIPLEPRSVATLRVLRPVPATAAPLTLAQDTLRLRSTALEDSAGTDLHLRTVVALLGGFRGTLVPDRDVVRPGTDLTVDLALTSTGNHDQDVLVAPVLPALGGPWIIASAAGAPPPWNLSLPATGGASLRVILGVPADAPPRSQASSILAFSVGAPGTNASVVPLLLNVEEHRAADAGAARVLDLSAGWTHAVEATVRNTGNVPMQVRVDLEGLPDGWAVETGEARIAVGATARVPLQLTVPLDAPPSLQATATVFDQESGRVLANAAWSLRVGHPLLQAEQLPTLELPQGNAYRVRVSNSGAAAAHNVTLTLLRNGAVIDRFELAQILPGASHVATLVGPAGSEAQILLAAAHIPEGSPLQALGQEVQGGPRGLPPAPPLAALVATALLAARRRRSP